MRIGSWNLGVPEENTCMGARKPKFKQYLYESMKKLDTFNFDVLVFQEVNLTTINLAMRS